MAVTASPPSAVVKKPIHRVGEHDEVGPLRPMDPRLADGPHNIVADEAGVRRVVTRAW
jgi:hypothetical protein